MIDLTVGATASAILATNEPTSVVVSFGASGFSEHDRYLEFDGVRMIGMHGSSAVCLTRSNSEYPTGLSGSNCPTWG